MPLHILTAVFLCLAAWLAGRRPGSLWAGELLLVAGVAFGAVAHRAVARTWPGPDPDRRRALNELLGGPTGYALLYVGSVLFAGAESFAAGLAFDEGAPVLALALLFPPVALAGYALRRTVDPGSFAGPSGAGKVDGRERAGMEAGGAEGEGAEAEGIGCEEKGETIGP